jgi:hypothetical protein
MENIAPPRSRKQADTAISALTVQFLAWVAERPRSRTEAMEAWRSTCPRLTIWEDAMIDGLVRLDGDGEVMLTERGRALLESGADQGTAGDS